jgi:hypothetical protein
MPAIITNKFRKHNSDQFYESFSEAAPNVYYLGIARPQSFKTSTRPDGRTENEGTDLSPITPADSIKDELYIYDDLLAVKKVTSSDVSYVIPRRNWISGQVYDYYRPDYGNRITNTTTTLTANSGASNLFDSLFYVLTSSYNVYKCLDNNNNSTSTVQPTGTSTSILTTADGYKWKYMYTLDASQQANFLSTDFMAVSTNSTVSSAGIDGGVHIVKIKTAGTSGTNGTYTNIPIRGDGTNGKVTVIIGGNAVTSVAVTNVGSGYTYGYITVADIISAGGSGLTGTELDIMIEPKGGHGFDAITELGGYFIMMNTSLQGSELANTADFVTDNDFRKVTLIKDPKSGGTAASTTTLRGTKAVRFAASPTPGTFQVDEKITQATTGAVGTVVSWDSTNRILYYIQPRFTNEGVDSNGNKTAFSGTYGITGATSSASGTPSSATETVNYVSFTSGYSDSEIDIHSGDVLYVENRAPITRASDQTENIKLIIEF